MLIMYFYNINMIKYFFPTYCVCCMREFTSSLCSRCLNRLQNTLPQCPICNTLSNGGYTHCNCKLHNIDQLITLYKYDKYTHKIIRYIKYKGCISIIDEVIKSNSDIIKRITPDSLLIPIPMHSSKRRERGYNVSEELAKRIAVITKSKVLNNQLFKTKYTKSQSTVSKKNRKLNIRDSFLWKSYDECINKIILIDDVITTKSTINEVIKTINKVQPNIRISIFCLFSAMKYH